MVSTKLRGSALSMIAAIVLVTGILVVLAPGAVATNPTCFVRNLTTTHLYRGSGPNLQKAIDAAAPGTTLTVRGVCRGNFTIGNGKDLKLVGIAMKAYPTPTLNGNAAGTVLTVSASCPPPPCTGQTPRAVVDVENLTITDGSTSDGGGGIFINVYGRVTLKGSTSVSGNAVTGAGDQVFNNSGGGIENDGRLTLKGSSSVSGNSATGSGGGIYNSNNFSILTMKGSSSVSGNSAGKVGGGIVNMHGAITMHGSSAVAGNTADVRGSGIYNRYGAVTLNDSARVNGNFGSGIHNDGGTLTLDDSARMNRNTNGGITNFGSLALNDSAQVNGNTGGEGGGILNYGTLIMVGSAQVNGNIADYDGGGVYNYGTVNMDGSAQVNGNNARGNYSVGGGIFNDHILIMNGSAQVKGNTSNNIGGGIANWVDGPGIITLKGSSSVTGNAARVGGGILDDSILSACNSAGVDEWIGAISPNNPDDPPTPTLITCT